VANVDEVGLSACAVSDCDSEDGLVSDELGPENFGKVFRGREVGRLGGTFGVVAFTDAK